MSFARAGLRSAVKAPASFGKPLARSTKARGDRRGIVRSAELVRVSSLPRRSLAVYDEAFAEAFSAQLRRAGSTFKLKPKQSAMLVEALEAGGLFGMVGVGGGKTVASPLFGHVMGLAPTVLLVPPAIKREIETRVLPWLMREVDFVPPMVVSYSELSTAGKGDILDRIQPKLIVADECHLLKNKNAARTKRFLRYLDENPDTVLVALSGTITRRSLMDFHHIVSRTHKDWKCPVTRQWREAKDWSLAIDPQVPPDERMAPGALLGLCQPGEELRDGFRRRLLETEGVVGGQAEDVDASLLFRKRIVEVPASVESALKALRTRWETPGGEQITDALDFARKARELAQGFYYVWDWPNGEPDEEWLFARKEWRRVVAAICKLNRQGLDSELLVRNACARDASELPKTVKIEGKAVNPVSIWETWDSVRDREEPPVRAVWVDDFLVRAALSWARKAEADGTPGLIWFDSRAVEEVAEKLGAKVCGAGSDGNRSLLHHSERRESRPPSLFVSSHAHGTGKNLQAWSRNLVLAPWSGGATWEQAIGRTHRPGQEADEVEVDVFVHTPELAKALDSALEQARYIEQVTGAGQKLLQAMWVSE